MVTAVEAGRVPVIALTGHLGAGKTTLLNHLLAQPGARLGVVVNDFGAINVDAALVSGQVDEPASIAGGCLCCLPDAGGLDDALTRLTHPRLGLDAVIVEASGLAEPGVLARLIRSSPVPRVRPGGLIDVVDAVEHFTTVDRDPRTPAPARYGAASLVLVNKTDRLTDTQRDDTLRRVEARVRERNPDAQVLPVARGRVDPTLVYDTTTAQDPPDGRRRPPSLVLRRLARARDRDPTACRMRFLIDMNLSPGWVDDLTRAGHHAEHWSTLGTGDAPDDALLAHAARHTGHPDPGSRLRHPAGP